MPFDRKYSSLRNHLLVLGGICLIALNLRPILTSVPPVLETIRFELGISHAVVSLLTTLPILLMGGCSLQAGWVSRRLGPEQGVFWSILALTLVSAARIWGDRFWVLIATAVAGGIAIAIGQTLLSGVIKRYFPDRAALVMGLYTSVMIAGAAMASGFTAPLSRAFGDWTWGLSVWALPAVGAVMLWFPVYLRANRQRRNGTAPSPSGRIPWGRTISRWITLLFCFQALIFASTMTWVAPFYVSLGWTEIEAGYLLSYFMWIQLIGSLLIPTLADRFRDRRPWIYLTAFLMGVGLLGMVLVPLTVPWLWAGVLGLGLGGQFPLSLTLPLDYADDPSMASRITSMAFGVGYSVAAVGPFLIGSMLDQGLGYTAAFVLLCLLAAAMGGVTTRFKPASPEDRSET